MTYLKEGFQFIGPVLKDRDLQSLDKILAEFEHSKKAGLRGLFQIKPQLTYLLQSEDLCYALHTFFPEIPFCIRSILFNKNNHSNWLVPWHRDLNIALKEKSHKIGFDSWSLKEGIHHAIAPLEIRFHHITLRVHLDDCTIQNGAMEVIPKSHHFPELDAEFLIEKKGMKKKILECKRGEAYLINPLILHRSSKSIKNAPRRVLHLEFSKNDLPNGLEYFEKYPCFKDIKRFFK